MKKNLLKSSAVQSLIASLICIVLGLLIGYIVLLFINPAGSCSDDNHIIFHTHPPLHRPKEKEIDWLQLAAKALPEDQEVLSSLIDALKALNADQEAMEHLWAFVEKDCTDSQLAYTLLSLLINGQKTAELDRFIALFEPESAIVLWSKIQRALNEKNLDQAKTLSFKMYELYPDYRGPISVLVYVFVEQKDFANAAKWKRTLANMEEDPRNQLWDVMSYLCAAENWDEARNVC